MYTSFDTERKLFEAEVERVAAKLVRDGIEPYIAITKATKIVAVRRAERAAKKKRINL